MDPIPDRPTTLSIAIGGYTGNSYAVEMTEDGLIYRSFSYGYEPNQVMPVTPDGEAWDAFRQALDDLDVWNWRPDYVNESIMDGTNWHVEIEWGEKRVQSGGSNGYPGGRESSRQFSGFLKAVSQLIGGRAFR